MTTMGRVRLVLLIVSVFGPVIVIFREPARLAYTFWNVQGDELTAKLLVWLALLSIFAFVGSVGVLEALVMMWKYKEALKAVALSRILFPSVVLLCVCPVIGKLRPHDFSPISDRFPVHFWYNTPWLTGFSIFIASCPMLLVGLESTRGRSNSLLGEVQRLRQDHDWLDRAVAFGASALGLCTITVGALRSAYVFANRPMGGFPAEYVGLWGLGLTMILISFYLPKKIDLHRDGVRIKGKLIGTCVTDGDYEAKRVVAICTVEDEIDDMLRLRYSDWLSISRALPTLAPLVIGWILAYASGR